MKISIIIPNKNGEALLSMHIPKVLDVIGWSEVIVVDDRSTDNSREVLEKFEAVRVINSEGKGFASAVNTGVKNATGDIVMLINTDVEPHKDFLKPLIKHFENQKMFAVGCLDRSHEPDGSVVLRGRGVAKWSKGFYVHEKGEFDGTHDTAWVSGGSSAFRKSLWDKLGGMDTIFNPFYWEDIDISYQALKAGYEIAFEPTSIVEHYHQKGAITTMYTSSYIREIAFRNQLFFIWKNMSDTKLWMNHLFFFPLFLIKSSFHDLSYLKGYIRMLIGIPKILQSRTKAKQYWKVHDNEMVYPGF